MASNKFNPPKFIDSPSEYPEYKRKLERWARITKVEAKKQAEVVLYHLEDHPSDIQSKIDVALGDNIVDKDDGMKQLIKYLDGIYAEDELTDVWIKYKEFVHLKKKNGQAISEFIAEFEKTYKRAKDSGCEFSDIVLGLNLLDSCKLSQTDEKFVLTGVDFKSAKDNKDLLTQVKNSLRKFQSRNKMSDETEDFEIKVKSEDVYLTNMNHWKDTLFAQGWRPPVEGGRLPSDGWKPPANRKQSKKGVRGKQTKKSKNPLGPDGKPLKCFGCKSEYHFYEKCDQKDSVRKRDEPEQPVQKKAEKAMLSTLLMSSSTSKKTENEFGMICEVFEEVEKEIVLVSYNEEELCFLVKEAGCRGVIDTGCSKTVAGTLWVKTYTARVSPEFADTLEVSPSSKVYQFGGGEKRVSSGCIQLPTVIGEKKVNISVEVVDADIPLLIGSNALEAAEAVLNFKNYTATFFDENVELYKVGSGHICIELFSKYLETHISDISQRDSKLFELLVAADEVDVKGLKKLHHLYGHTSADKLLKFLKKAGKNSEKLKDTLNEIERTCDSCNKSKRRKPRPKTAIPRVDRPNQIVTIDLKTRKDNADNKYICYLIDMYSRYTVASFIPDKKPDTIVQCVLQHWICLFGVMEGIHSDIGGEMSNNLMEEVAHKLDVKLTTTAAYSPHQNGLNERNHSVVDLMLTRMLASDNSLSPEMALRWSLNAKNSLDNVNGYSPYQLHIGINPTLPSVTRDGPSSFSSETKSQSFADNLNAMHAARREFTKMESSNILKKALKSRVFPRGSDIEEGDWIYFKKNMGRCKEVLWSGPSKVVAVNGKKLFIDQGARLGTVNRDDAVRQGEEFWRMDDIIPEDSEQEIDVDDSSDEDESSTEIESENEASDNQEEVGIDDVNDNDNGDEESVEESNDEFYSQDDESKGEKKETDSSNDETFLGFEEEDPPEDPNEIVSETVAITQEIIHENDRHTDSSPSTTTDVASTGEPNYVSILNDKRCGATKNVDALVVTVPRYLHNEQDCVSAKNKELDNWDKFRVYKEVKYEGQPLLSTNWILVYKEGGVKARLCIRGDLEEGKENIKTDSPTVNKINIKLFYVLAAFYKWPVRTADVKAAFLQGAAIDREVFVQPPKERRSPGIVWQMLKRVYGFVDASRGFYIELDKTLTSLGCKPSAYDPALYIYWNKEGTLGGLVLTHVDDFLHGSGDAEFETNVMTPLKEKFEFGREEEQDFKYVGMHVTQENNCIIIDQNQYVEELDLRSSEELEEYKDLNMILNEEWQSEFRAAVGKIGWLANISRPDLAYDNLALSTKLGKATLRDMKYVYKVLRKVKCESTTMKFVDLGPVKEWSLEAHGDAGYKSLPDKTSSCGGYVVLLCNRQRGIGCVLNWKSRKLRRVVSSSTAAEALAVNEALDEMVYVKTVLSEMIGSLSQLPMQLVTDSRNLHKTILSSKLADNPRIRTDIAKVQESLKNKELDEFVQVSGKDMLADVLTKKGAPGFNIMKILRTCILEK